MVKARSISGTLAAAALVLCASFLVPRPAMAEITVGVLITSDVPYYQEIHKSFTEALTKKYGDVRFVLQWPAANAMSWTNSARKLVVIGSDIIVTYGAAATLTTMKETSSIPILFAGVHDPASMNMEGKNATGVSSNFPMKDTLALMKRVKNFSSLGVVFNKAEKDTILQVKDIKQLEASMGFRMELLNAGTPEFVGQMKGLDALFLTTCAAAMARMGDIEAASRQTGMLVGSAVWADKAVVIARDADPRAQGTELAGLAVRVLGGESVQNVAVLDLKKPMTLVNLKAASAAGISVPADVTSSATEVIK